MASPLRLARYLKTSLLTRGASSRPKRSGQLFNIPSYHNVFDQRTLSGPMSVRRSFASLSSVITPFVRSYVIKMFCPYPFDSFSLYKEETAQSLRINFLPGLEKTMLYKKQICVSLNMPELMVEDVKSYFKHGAFFIEGKTKTATKTKTKTKAKVKTNTETKKVHYITCIRLPKNFLKKRNMIKTEMQDGMYKATLSPVNAKFKII